jgi:hypothetical protein
MQSPALIRTLALATAICATAPALAQSVTLDTAQPASGDFMFSTLLLEGYGIVNGSVGAYGPAATNITTPDGQYTDSSGSLYSGNPGDVIGVSAPLTSVSFNPDNTLHGITSTGGNGNYQQFPVVPSITSGGTLYVTDLGYDPATNQVTATLNGANGVGTYSGAVFSIGQLDYSTDGGATFNTIANPGSFAFAPGTYELRASDLFLASTSGTGNVRDYMIQALGIKSLGVSVFDNINNPTSNPAGFGTLTTTFTVAAVPEPSTYAMLALGLAGVAGSAVRRQRR